MTDVTLPTLVERFKLAQVAVGDQSLLTLTNRGTSVSNRFIGYTRQMRREIGKTFTVSQFLDWWSKRRSSATEAERGGLDDVLTEVQTLFAQTELPHLTEEEQHQLATQKQKDIGPLPPNWDDTDWLSLLIGDLL